MSEKNRPTAIEIRRRNRDMIRRICICGILIALSIVAKLYLSVSVPFLGPGGMNVGLTGVVSSFPALLFGGLYGGVTSALCDIIGHFVKPTGAYIPWLSVTAFIGGFLKGVFFRFFSSKKAKKVILAGFLCFFAAVFVLGCVIHVGLTKDGVISDFFPTIKGVPTRGSLNGMELSGLSEAVCSLAKYNKDTLTLISAPDTETVSLPYVSGANGKLQKTGANSVVGEHVRIVFIPQQYTTIDPKTFGGRTDITIVSTKNSAAQTFAEANGLQFRTLAEGEFFIEWIVDPEDVGTECCGCGIKTSDTYRKYLAGYLSFATVGLELIGLAGAIIIALSFLRVGKEDAEEKSGSFNFQSFCKIAFCLVVPGVIVTTVNTLILREYTAAWAGRAFMILWIPRLIEEVIVCLIQSYLVTLLYEFYRTKIEPKFR